jgi:hypothetical protein
MATLMRVMVKPRPPVIGWLLAVLGFCDTERIQEAIDLAAKHKGTLRFERGIYRIDKPLEWRGGQPPPEFERGALWGERSAR